MSLGTCDLSNLYKGFLREALSFSPLCGLLIGHDVLCVAERLLVLPRWQETAADRRALLKQPQLLFLILFRSALLVNAPYTGGKLCGSLCVANVALVAHPGAITNVYKFWSLRSFLCSISNNVFCMGVKRGRSH